MFEKLTGNEKTKLFNVLKLRDKKWFIRTGPEHLVEAELIRVMPGKVAVLQVLHKPAIGRKNGNFVVNFTHRNRTFFMQTKVNIDAQTVYMDLTTDIFVLQRRKSDRIEIPSDGDIRCLIRSIRFRTVGLKAQVVEFGPLGCRIFYGSPTPVFKVDSTIRVEFRVLSRLIFETDCIVRHVSINYTKGKAYQIFGVQFRNPSPSLKSKLLLIFMDLQRKMIRSSQNNNLGI